MVPSAFLRVFQPLDAFEREEQLHWERYLLDGPAAQSLRPRYADHRTVGVAGAAGALRGRARRGAACRRPHVMSPRRMRMRVLAAMLSFREAQPMELWEQFVPKKEARRAARDLARFRRRDPSAVAFCHQSPWHVPIRWFVLFRDDERRLTRPPRPGAPTALPHHDEPGDPASRAGGRCRCAGPTWARSAISSSICTSGCTRSTRASLLELDYGELCRLPDVGRAGRRPQSPRDIARGARGAGSARSTREPPTSTRAC